MKDLKRSIRRHHVERLKKVRKSYLRFNWWLNQEKRLGILAKTPAACSCPMCGNERRFFGKTLREISQEEFDKTVLSGEDNE